LVLGWDDGDHCKVEGSGTQDLRFEDCISVIEEVNIPAAIKDDEVRKGQECIFDAFQEAIPPTHQ